ncbi:MAG: SMC family ATPase [Actinomycetota bacterium]|nr:SMC family ATPase [Actinomycetota bacterium]
MRPLRLELQGFTSFRERTEIDFSDCELFALVGPTGSGKSTVIDAICFVLYGSVPRYEHKGLVAPVISQGKLEAKVRLDFTLGETEYSAVRVIRQLSKGNATTKEAVLECGGEVLARGAVELTAAISELLGLSFDHFTRCVVLPQGEFSRFLHDGPKDRQGMIVKLLNLGIYERMSRRAQALANEARIDCEVNERRLEEDFADANPEALQRARSGLARLQALQRTVREATPRLTELAERKRTAEAATQEALKAISLLDSLEVPAEVTALGTRLSLAASDLADAEAQTASAGDELAVRVTARATHGPREPILEALAAHRSRRELTQAVAEKAKNVEAATSRLDGAQSAHDAANARIEAASASEDAARSDHAAHELASGLSVGDDCPVCLQLVSELPAHEVPPDLEVARAELMSARADGLQVAAELNTAATEVAAAQAGMNVLEQQRTLLDAALAEERDEKTLTEVLASIEEAEQGVEAARAAEAKAIRNARAARKEWEELQRAERKLRRQFDDRRDRLATLRPPSADGSDLAADWGNLARWAATRSPELHKEAAACEASAAEAAKEQTVLIEDLERSCRDCELEVVGGAVFETVTSAVAQTSSEVRGIAQSIAAAEKLRGELNRLRAEAKVASGLALELSAKPGRFESWIVEEALRRLVEGATRTLNELSSSQYSMTLSDTGDFLVIDHHNADETRSAKTLSGGETFLASLSLALSLSDQLSELAERGAARLDAIFLDEGFGTLDADTLETVAATVENLAATGRMVGIVTHVRELAERVPLQFRVRKNQITSTVQRVPDQELRSA